MTESELAEQESWASDIGGSAGTRVSLLVTEVRRLSQATLQRTLREMRGATGKSQGAVAAAAEMHQGDVSDLERRTDFKVSTLRSFARGLGGAVRVLFDIPGQPTFELVAPKDPKS